MAGRGGSGRRGEQSNRIRALNERTRARASARKEQITVPPDASERSACACKFINSVGFFGFLAQAKHKQSMSIVMLMVTVVRDLCADCEGGA